MRLEASKHKIAVDRLSQIFRFLGALNDLRNPVTRLIHEQPWIIWLRNLPQHPLIERGTYEENPQDKAEESNSQNEPAFILRVRRHIPVPPPNPQEEIAAWLLPGWKDIEGTVSVHPSQNEINKEGETQIINFEDDPVRPELLRKWTTLREKWLESEKPARETLKVFERLYELHGHIEREGEQMELVLGDGILNWKRDDGGVEHPILLQRIQLKFDPEIPEFTLIETEAPVELYSALFRSMPDVDGRSIGRCREELSEGQYHPLGGADTSGFLRRLVVMLSPRGEFTGDGKPQGWEERPRIGRDSLVFMRKRTLGYTAAIEAIIEGIKTTIDLPGSCVTIVGVEPDRPEPDHLKSISPPPPILFSKPSNPEQEAIAQKLEKHGCVLVQGPPGTGKTHTIANLIGHLLAQGKSILVTSHTTKALRVLREKVESSLQALCVSVLESDMESRKQLENSVQGIGERLSSEEQTSLESRTNALAEERQQVSNKLSNTRQALLNAMYDEYRPLIIAGNSYTPSEAAKIVKKSESSDNWIPGPVALGSTLPLSIAELTELYETNVSVTEESEHELQLSLPDPDQLLTPVDFERLVNEHKAILERGSSMNTSLWLRDDQIIDELKNFLTTILKSIQLLKETNDWRIFVMEAGRLGGSHRQPWDKLLIMIEEAYNQVTSGKELFLKYDPSLPEDGDLSSQLVLFGEIIEYLKNGKRLNRWILWMRPAWKQLVRSCLVASKSPENEDHFKALYEFAKLKLGRQELMDRWERQVVPLGGPSISATATPELSSMSLWQSLKDCLEWYGTAWLPVRESFDAYGFLWDGIAKNLPSEHDHSEYLSGLRGIASDLIPKVFNQQIDYLRMKDIEKALGELASRIYFSRQNTSPSKISGELKNAVDSRDPVAYRNSYDQLVELYRQNHLLLRRKELLKRLETAAPGWATAISFRKSPHDQRDLPGDPKAAWISRQLHDELVARSKTSLDKLQSEMAALNEKLQTVTAGLIDQLAWIAQLKRTGLRQRQALNGWMLMIKKIGKGTGKRAPRLLVEAQKLMNDCRSAVPVWIMPLSRVVENFDPRTNRFDVVIVDEASQSDVMALIACYMGSQVIIVGDHEQVSPEAIGIKIDETQHLIDEHLRGIPNANLYDGQTSIYDLAQASFDAPICLREHFRCVPEIIQFSNHLSYDNKIKPLRDHSKILPPYVVPYRVQGAASQDKVNPTEAITLASLLCATMEQPEYEKNDLGETTSFGVISLVGEEQALFVERILRRYLSPAEFTRRRIVCGKAAQFQGDERDVIFLSLVDGPNPSGGTLPKREAGAKDMFKKRFNVSASRARNQEWLIYSLDPDIDLQPGDLRHRLIEYAKDPKAFMAMLEDKQKKTGSEFERLVLAKLISEGYTVTPQWRVGTYRIDLVIRKKEEKIAIECDGDRYHTLETLGEDLEREAILRRLGWTFIRIRGSEFFRNPDKTMASVFTRLSDLGMTPEGIGDITASEKEDSELIERIKRRAEELRRNWNDSGFSEDLLQSGRISLYAPKFEETSQVPQKPIQQVFTRVNDTTTAKSGLQQHSVVNVAVKGTVKPSLITKKQIQISFGEGDEKMKNVELNVEGDTLLIKVDLTKEFGPSQSGKTIIVASTEGPAALPDRVERVNLNVYRKK